VAKPPFKPGWYAELVVDAARRGDPYPLIGHLQFCLQSGKPLSDGEIQFIVAALEATAGKRSADNLRKTERFLIAEQVEGLMRDEGRTQKAAIDEVMRYRGRSRRHVYSALKARKGKS
jgi:hypothetical protein